MRRGRPSNYRKRVRVKKEDMDNSNTDATIDFSDDNYLYLNPASPATKKRKCLKCGKRFLSTDAGNRHCDKCRKENARMDTGYSYSVSLWQLGRQMAKGH